MHSGWTWLEFWSTCNESISRNEENFETYIIKAFADFKSSVTQKMDIVLKNGYKTSWEKEKMLVTSIFSLSHYVFRRPLLHPGWV